MAMFHMAGDSGLFSTRQQLETAGWKQQGNRYEMGQQEVLPLMEAKMFHLFDHRFGTYEGATQANYNKGFLPHFGDADHQDAARLTLPDYWIASTEVDARLVGRWSQSWLLGWRDTTRQTFRMLASRYENRPS